MHRIIITIGLILFPLGLSAAPTPVTGALSPWVQGVLDRAEDVIKAGGAAEAAANPQSPCEQDQLENIAEHNVSLVRGWINATTHLTQEAGFLKERTVCFEYDRRLLLQELEKVMDKMSLATAVCDADQATVLNETFQFLTRAYLSFLQGAIDPAYKDNLLRERFHFDTKDPDPAAPLCPFTTDYGPHSIGYLKPVSGAPANDPVAGYKSYGCDLDMLQSLPSSFSMETGPMIQFMRQTNAVAEPMYNDIRNALMNLQDLVNLLAGGSVSPGGSPSLPPPPPHRSVSGCLKPVIPDRNDPSYTEDIESLLAAFPAYFDPENQDPQNGLSPSPETALPNGVLLLPSFDSFLTASNPLILLQRFMMKELDTGRNRPLPEYLFLQETGDMIPMHLLLEMESPDILRQAAGNSQMMIGMLEAGSRDALERMEDLSLPLKAAVLSLADVVENDFPKKYIPDFAFFAARSCVDGPCQKTLETVIQRSLNPYCHPYLSGRYRDEDSYKRCFCDPTTQSNWSDYDKYCSATYNEAVYSARPEALIPACFGE